MAFIEDEGRTLEEAVSKGLQRIGLPRDEVKVEVLEHSRKFFGLLGTPHIKVRLTYETRSAKLHTATDLLQKMLAHMGIHARVEGSERHGEAYLNIQSDDSGLLIGRRGQTIDALQYLVNRMVNRDADAAVRIVLDTEHYQERREERLTRLAQRLAAQVKSTGRAAVMAPLNARDRRIIHLALQADREVSTSSKGEGALRKVLIAPRRSERSQSREV